MKRAKQQKIIIANGVNLDLLGQRESQWYGDCTLQEIESLIRSHADAIAAAFSVQIDLHFFATNHEAEVVAILKRLAKMNEEVRALKKAASQLARPDAAKAIARIASQP